MTLDEVLSLPAPTLSILRDCGLSPEEVAARTTAKQVNRTACKLHGVSWQSFMRGGEVRFSRMRYTAMWAMRELQLSLSEIAEALEMSDHTSVIHGVRRVETTPELLAQAREILARVESGGEIGKRAA